MLVLFDDFAIVQRLQRSFERLDWHSHIRAKQVHGRWLAFAETGKQPQLRSRQIEFGSVCDISINAPTVFRGPGGP